MSKEKPETNDADEQDGHGQIGAVEKSVQRPAVGSDYALDKIARPSFHSSAFMTRLAFAENARAHQRRQGQGNQPGGENRHNDRDRKFLEDATE